MIPISACANQPPQKVWCNFVNRKLYRTTASRYSTVNISAIVKPATLELDSPYPLCDKSAGNRPHDSARVPPYRDRKSTRLNSSHQIISYAVFCLKKKKK